MKHSKARAGIPLPSQCLSGNISERKLAFSGCEQSLVPEGDLSRWRLRRLKNPMISRSGFRTDTEVVHPEVWLLSQRRMDHADEGTQTRRDRVQAALSGCSGLAGADGCGCDPSHRGDRGQL